MSKFSLLKDLDDKGKDQIDEKSKIKYQSYDIELGIERIKVCVPIEESNEFEVALDNIEEVNSHTLYKLAKQYKGYTQDI